MKQKMKEWKEKATEFYDRHRLAIGFLGCAAVGAVCYKIGDGLSGARMEIGMRKCIDQGYIVLTRPTDDGNIPSIPVLEWCDLIRKEVK